MVKEHGLLVFLPPELQVGLIKFQAAKELGKSYAGLYLLNEALFAEKFISEATYQTFKRRYSHKLVDDEQTKLQPDETFVASRRELQNLQRQFSMVIDQWHFHDTPWRKKWISLAEQHKNSVPNAKLILDLGGKA